MICSRCHRNFEEELARCPQCGEQNPENTRLYQTSLVRIAAGGEDLVYRSVDEVPAPLRRKLLATTNSPNSRTILIADSRGRKEIARAMRSLPAQTRRRKPGLPLGPKWALIAGVLAGMAIALLVIWSRHWY